eukprot:COSAG01_NODE_16632_length_1219_cov_1.222321_1_plen_285_part_01
MLPRTLPRALAATLVLCVTVGAASAAALPPSVVLVQPSSGQRFRVQALSTTMLRVEAEGSKGFEDRLTFLVQNRSWGAGAPALHKEGASRAACQQYAVDVDDTKKVGQIAVLSASGGVLWSGNLTDVDARTPMPQPAEQFAVWAMADRPRFTVPAGGALPGSAPSFDLSNQADDVYFFVPTGSGGDNNAAPGLPYTTLRTEYLRLSGPVPLLPDYAFGTMFTWYHNYSDVEKLAEITEFASRGIPLDVASLDMDWRLHPCYPNSLTPNCTDTPVATEAQYVTNTA